MGEDDNSTPSKKGAAINRTARNRETRVNSTNVAPTCGGTPIDRAALNNHDNRLCGLLMTKTHDGKATRILASHNMAESSNFRRGGTRTTGGSVLERATLYNSGMTHGNNDGYVLPVVCSEGGTTERRITMYNANHLLGHGRTGGTHSRGVVIPCNLSTVPNSLLLVGCLGGACANNLGVAAENRITHGNHNCSLIVNDGSSPESGMACNRTTHGNGDSADEVNSVKLGGLTIPLRHFEVMAGMIESNTIDAAHPCNADEEDPCPAYFLKVTDVGREAEVALDD